MKLHEMTGFTLTVGRPGRPEHEGDPMNGEERGKVAGDKEGEQSQRRDKCRM